MIVNDPKNEKARYKNGREKITWPFKNVGNSSQSQIAEQIHIFLVRSYIPNYPVQRIIVLSTWTEKREGFFTRGRGYSHSM